MGVIEYPFRPKPRSVAGTRLSQARLMRAIAYMRERMAEPLELRQVAAAVDMSVYHFARAFRNTTGIPPYRYLMDCRVDRVRELLSLEEIPLADIAARTGFADQSHMSNVFRRATGESPLAYRRRARGTAVD